MRGVLRTGEGGQPGVNVLKAELMRLFTQDLPWLPLYYLTEHVTVRSNVKGVEPRQAALRLVRNSLIRSSAFKMFSVEFA